MVHYYYGNGKGKTSAAVGACVRAAGSGMRCAFVQFLKNGTSSEVSVLEKIGVQVLVCAPCRTFFKRLTPGEQHAVTAVHNENIRRVLTEHFDFVVLDELGDAISRGAVDTALVAELLEMPCELVITGHKPVSLLAGCADYLTEFCCIAHPFQKGTTARRGIEY